MAHYHGVMIELRRIRDGLSGPSLLCSYEQILLTPPHNHGTIAAQPIKSHYQFEQVGFGI
jgi:hypothetical protein